MQQIQLGLGLACALPHTPCAAQIQLEMDLEALGKQHECSHTLQWCCYYYTQYLHYAHGMWVCLQLCFTHMACMQHHNSGGALR